jgi:hypothetical protein
VSAVVDKSSGRVVAVLAVGPSGTQYLGTVDGGQPSRLVLEAQKGRGAGGRRGGAFALPTRYDALDLANRRQVEAIFRTPGWEDALVPLRR